MKTNILLASFLLLCASTQLPAGEGKPAALPAASPLPLPSTPIVVPSDVPDGRKYAQGKNQTFEALKKRVAAMNGDCDMIFIGASITQWWDAAIWRHYYGSRKALDYGISGDNTQNVLFRLQDQGVKALRPKVAVLLVGGNNSWDKPENIAKGVKAVVEATRADFPGVKIILLDILPTARNTAHIAEANALIAKFSDDKEVYRLDLSPKMPREGDSWRGLREDKLHLTPEGYRIWAEAMEPLLSKLLGDRPEKPMNTGSNGDAN